MADRLGTRLKMLQESGWRSSDGPVQGFWINRPPGARCLWSVRWLTEDGIVEPADLVPPDGKMLIVEDGRVVQIGPYEYTAEDLERLDCADQGKDISLPMNYLRDTYDVYVWPWGRQPDGVYKQPIRLREGWPTPEWYRPHLAKAGSSKVDKE